MYTKGHPKPKVCLQELQRIKVSAEAVLRVNERQACTLNTGADAAFLL